MAGLPESSPAMGSGHFACAKFRNDGSAEHAVFYASDLGISHAGLYGMKCRKGYEQPLFNVFILSRTPSAPRSGVILDRMKTLNHSHIGSS